MNYNVITDTTAANGTSLCGFVRTDLATLIKKLGEPIQDHSGDGKVTCEWILSFHDGTVATIYDWKMSNTPTEEYNWHIGGKGVSVVEKFGFVLGLPAFRD
jgi:hypothetical protein